MQELRARIHAGEIPAGLDALAGLASGSFFQRADWLSTVSRAEPRYRPFVVGVEDGNGALQAAVPCVAVMRFGLGAILYLVAALFAFVSPWVTLAIVGAMAVYYLFEQTGEPEPEPGAA